MSRSPLFRILRRAARIAHAAERLGLPADELHQMAAERRGLDRRAFMAATGAGLAAVPLVGCGDDSSEPGGKEAQTVGVVGAGLGGLHAALRLEEGGLPVRIFDANDRVGGRTFTLRDQFPGELVCEMGGELINSDHATLWALAEEFDIQIDDLHADDPPGLVEDVFRVGGVVIPEDEISRAFQPMARAMAMIADEEEDDDAFDRWDNTSIAAWFDAIGAEDPIRSIIGVTYVGEYGLELDQQSLWNLIWLIDYEEVEPFRVLGESDERYHARGGSQTFTDRMAGALSADVELGHRLIRVSKDADGRVRLFFDVDGNTVDEAFDHVVFALPFTQLRKVEFTFELPEEKRQIIDELGYGTNSKLMLGTRERIWRTRMNQSGSVTSDTGELQSVWATSRAVPGESGVLTNFVGGERGVSIGEGDAEDQAQTVMPWLEESFPGFGEVYEAGSAVRMHWPSAAHFEGSYQCYLPGQAWFWSLEGTPVDNMHFCGEHTSLDYTGFMEGAAETGAAVAAAILETVGRGSSQMALRSLGPRALLPQAATHGRLAGKLRRLERRRMVRHLSRRRRF